MDGNQPYSIEDIKAEQDAVRRKKMLLGAVGSIGDALSNGTSAADIYLKTNPRRINTASSVAGTVSENMRDPMKDVEQSHKISGMNREVDEKDPNSEASKNFIESLGAYSPAIAQKLAGKSAYEAKQLLPLLTESDKFKRQQDWDMKKLGYQRNTDLMKNKAAQDIKNQGLVVPGLGMANTVEDAKALKSAQESKSKLDRQVKELITLREKYGAEQLNRDAIARAKQLSNDILLSYKNLAKLGVLSKSDEAIIDEIVPKDPLEFRAMDTLTGSDSILTKLKGFSGDINKDFETTVGQRLQGGQGAIQGLRDKQNAPPQSDPVHGEAVQWAKQNMSDPRAMEILKLNGIDPSKISRNAGAF